MNDGAENGAKGRETSRLPTPSKSDEEERSEEEAGYDRKDEFENEEAAKNSSAHPDACGVELAISAADPPPEKRGSDWSADGGDDSLRGLSRLSTDLTSATEESISTIDPPPSRAERFRDALFSCLDLSILRILGFVVIFFVVVDGAFFFFLMVGAHGMCAPKTDCEPRNWWLNWSIQVLNALFTYTALVSFPPRLSNAVHLLSRKRSSEVGKDHYGRDTRKMWFHIPPKRRGCIVALLLGNCFSQFANQITRIKFHDYELSNTWPGVLWVNLFFLLAMFLAAVGALWQILEQHKLHKHEPEKFPPGPVAIFQNHREKFCCPKRKSNGDDEGDLEAAKKRRTSMGSLAQVVGRKVTSPGKQLVRWLKNIRPSMRLWGF